MFREEKNIKDTNLHNHSQREESYSSSFSGEIGSSLSYTKTNKLITALYMVTDTIDKDEPLRNKLRTLGIEIISDINFISLNIHIKISEIMSFLDIASAINIVSEMNYSILKKEFLELNKSIKEFTGKIKTIDRQINLSEFFREKLPLARQDLAKVEGRENSIGHYYKGHQYPTRIGVQKGSTLLKALSKVERMKVLSDRIGAGLRPQRLGFSHIQNFEILKKQRHNDIINIIKNLGGNVTIKDIKDRVKNLPSEFSSLASCGEKTLQRELVLMVKDSVLNKVGEKRWSRYFLKN